MAKDPAVLFYTSDFLSGTSFFSYEEKGQYITLLCQQHQLGGIPENHMITICGSNDSIVFSKFIKDDKGLYYNKRMRDEAERRKSYCDSRSNNKSGRPKKEKKKIIRKSYDSNMNIHMETETITETDNINKAVINDLNAILGTNYKINNKATKEMITARVREGFTVDDFKEVHRKMLKAWGADSEMYKYLRPNTLYRQSKFEGYLNMREPQTKLTENGVKAYLIGQEWLKNKELKNA